MSVFYYEPFYNWDRLFDEALSGRLTGSGQQQTLTQGGGGGNGEVQRFLKPKMDLHENEQTNTVTATFEFPGLKKEDISIDVHNGRLSVSGESKISQEREQEGYAVRERRYGKFSRTLQLPQGVKDEDIKASMENGILTVTFPKASAEAIPRKIAIN